MYAVGIDLGGTSIKGALVEEGQGLIHQRAIDTESDEGPSHVLDRIAALVRELRGKAPEGLIEGVGIGSPGSIDWMRTTVRRPPNLPGWMDVNVRDEIQTRLGEQLPVLVENDANAAGDYILDATRSAIVRFVTPGLRENLLVIQETLGNEVGMLGAARLIFEYLDEQPSDSVDIGDRTGTS